MQYNIKTTDFEMTPDVSHYLNERLISLEKFVTKDDESVKCDVEIGRTTKRHQSGDIFRVELNVSIGKDLLRTEATKESINAAIDEAKDEMSKRLRRYKGKRATLFRKGADRIKKMVKFRR